MLRLLIVLLLLSTTPVLAVEKADLERQAARVREAMPGFTVVVEAPFVVAGDEDPDTVRSRAEGIVRWAVQRLERDFFRKQPRHVVTIYLFRDRESYESNVARLFGGKPSSPYGYYTSHHRALVMNISTGGGTLVHEIVHPYVEADFPRCPTWMNEGLASLFEQCGEREGRIVGYTNWRLAGLQDAIRAGTVPTFARLLAMDQSTFYSTGRGTNYAASRYLCYYLQERGLLIDFYKSFRRNHPTDPTGQKTLQKTLGDLKSFQPRWQRYVLTLRFP